MALMGKFDDPETMRMRNEKRPVQVHMLQTHVPVTDDMVPDMPEAQGILGSN
jgi:hypothetical protein